MTKIAKRNNELLGLAKPDKRLHESSYCSFEVKVNSC